MDCTAGFSEWEFFISPCLFVYVATLSVWWFRYFSCFPFFSYHPWASKIWAGTFSFWGLWAACFSVRTFYFDKAYKIEFNIFTLPFSSVKILICPVNVSLSAAFKNLSSFGLVLFGLPFSQFVLDFVNIGPHLLLVEVAVVWELRFFRFLSWFFLALFASVC